MSPLIIMTLVIGLVFAFGLFYDYGLRKQWDKLESSDDNKTE